MSLEYQTRLCSHEGCKGTQTFRTNATPPGSQSGVLTEKGTILWGPNRHPGWNCDKNGDHFEEELPPQA
jgi:hypothetical protein